MKNDRVLLSRRKKSRPKNRKPVIHDHILARKIDIIDADGFSRISLSTSPFKTVYGDRHASITVSSAKSSVQTIIQANGEDGGVTVYGKDRGGVMRRASLEYVADDLGGPGDMMLSVNTNADVKGSPEHHWGVSNDGHVVSGATGASEAERSGEVLSRYEPMELIAHLLGRFAMLKDETDALRKAAAARENGMVSADELPMLGKVDGDGKIKWNSPEARAQAMGGLDFHARKRTPKKKRTAKKKAARRAARRMAA